MFKKFIHRPVLSIVISLIITLLGVLALIQLPVTQFPSISPPKVNISAEYPGANGELMTKAVLIPLERAINGVPGMKYMSSDAGNDGEASIQVVFNLGTDPNVAAINIQNPRHAVAGADNDVADIHSWRDSEAQSSDCQSASIIGSGCLEI